MTRKTLLALLLLLIAPAKAKQRLEIEDTVNIGVCMALAETMGDNIEKEWMFNDVLKLNKIEIYLIGYNQGKTLQLYASMDDNKIKEFFESKNKTIDKNKAKQVMAKSQYEYNNCEKIKTLYKLEIK